MDLQEIEVDSFDAAAEDSDDSDRVVAQNASYHRLYYISKLLSSCFTHDLRGEVVLALGCLGFPCEPSKRPLYLLVVS